MLNKYIQIVLQVLVKRIVREEVRMGGLKAVRAYIQGVGYVRIGALGLIGLIAFVALVMTGVVLTVGGVLALVGVTSEALAWTATISGLVLMVIGGVVMVMAFNQKRWLDLSRAYELMDAVVEPVPTAAAVPKNMVRAFKGEPMEHAPRATIEPKHVPVREPRASVPLRPQTI